MRYLVFALSIVLVASPAAAQDRPQNPQALRQIVMERFLRNFVTQAGLTEEQQGEFRELLQDQFETRRRFELRRRDILRGLEEQLRPGVAASADSVTTLLDNLVGLEEEMAASMRAEQAALAETLSPVQRALFVIHFERFQRQIESIQQRRGRRQGNLPR